MRKKGSYRKNKLFCLLAATALRFVQSYLNDIAHKGIRENRLSFFYVYEQKGATNYRHEGVNDYITAPVNIPDLIRRVLFFVE